MSYVQKKYRYGNQIEIRQYHTAQYGAPGQPRQKKTKPTAETVKRQNQKRKEERTARIIAANFEPGDYVRTLTFARDKRPANMDEAKKIFKSFYQKLRKEYRKRFYELYWLCNIECTPRGAWHIHFMCNAIFGGGDLIKELWTYGGVYDQLLRDLSDKDLGAYMAKTPDSTAEGEHQVSEAKQSHSKNLIIPQAEKKVIGGWKLRDKPRIPKGWYLIKESYFEGVNDEGYKYRHYKLASLKPAPPKDRSWRPPEKKGKKSEGRHLHSRGKPPAQKE